MALEFYAGPFCRYLGGDWETAIKQWESQPIAPAGESSVFTRLWSKLTHVEPPPRPEDPRPKIEAWRQQIAATGRFGATGEWQWPETFQAPYQTEKPAFDGWGALQVWAAHVESGSLPSGPLDLDDEYLVRAQEREVRARFHQIYLPDVWVPPKFSPSARGPLPAGGEGWIGSVPQLLAQLEELHALSHGALTAPGSDVDSEDVASLARWGYGIIVPLARFAAENQTPLVLGY